MGTTCAADDAQFAGYWDSCPALSLDEHRLYFTQLDGREGAALELYDIWVSRRQDRRDDFGWEPPVNFGCQVNSPANDVAPSFFEDETGTVVMYFGSNRVGARALTFTRAECSTMTRLARLPQSPN